MLFFSSTLKNKQKKISFRLFCAETILRIKNHAVKKEAFSSAEVYERVYGRREPDYIQNEKCTQTDINGVVKTLCAHGVVGGYDDIVYIYGSNIQTMDIETDST